MWDPGSPSEKRLVVPIGDHRYWDIVSREGSLYAIERKTRRRGECIEISNKGRKRSSSGVVREPPPRQDGYVICNVSGVKHHLMHQFVCSLFHGPRPSSRHTVDHIDGNRSNNDASNLRWLEWEGQHKNKKFRADAWKKTSVSSILCGEVWVSVFNGKAAVSNLGRWKSSQGHISFPRPATNGYVSVCFNTKNYKLHVLVCTAFHGPKPSPKHTVNHKDKDRSNNSASNLEWMTYRDQSLHSFANGRHASKHTSQGKPVYAKLVGDTTWTLYDTVNEAALAFNVSPGNAAACARGMWTSTKGVEFKYTDFNMAIPGEEWKSVFLCEWQPGGKYFY